MNNVLCATLFDMALFNSFREFIGWLIGVRFQRITEINNKKLQFIYHDLRSSASPVLTATVEKRKIPISNACLSPAADLEINS